MTNLAIETHGLTRSYDDTRVLLGLDLEIPRGTVYGLLGQNGAGKTTLVRILATLLPPDSGAARVLGHDVVRDRAHVRRAIGLTGQYASVDELLTGQENLVQLARLLRIDRRSAHRRAKELLERFDLTDAAGRRVATYSGGMRRRLDLAASLLAAPPVLFLDEPTTGLDPRSRRSLWDVIAELTREGTTILLTTQYLEEADHLADRIGVLDGGRLVVEGTANELKRRVGQDLLTVTVAPGDRERAAGVLDVSAATDAALSVPLQGPDHLHDLLDRLAQANIQLDQVRVSAPTLDDVFLTITHRDDVEEPAA
jgi:ABC-2 type transport system ATP-binding protein